MIIISFQCVIEILLKDFMKLKSVEILKKELLLFLSILIDVKFEFFICVSEFFALLLAIVLMNFRVFTKKK